MDRKKMELGFGRDSFKLRTWVTLNNPLQKFWQPAVVMHVVNSEFYGTRRPTKTAEGDGPASG
jgi:hypothetical protein